MDAILPANANRRAACVGQNPDDPWVIKAARKRVVVGGPGSGPPVMYTASPASEHLARRSPRTPEANCEAGFREGFCGR